MLVHFLTGLHRSRNESHMQHTKGQSSYGVRSRVSARGPVHFLKGCRCSRNDSHMQHAMGQRLHHSYGTFFVPRRMILSGTAGPSTWKDLHVCAYIWHIRSHHGPSPHYSNLIRQNVLYRRLVNGDESHHLTSLAPSLKNKHTHTACRSKLRRRELNPGLPRDRRKY